MFAFVATLLWQILVAGAPRVATGTGVVLTVGAAVALLAMLRLTRRNVASTLDRVDLTNW